jgi:hypothetical protein
LNKHVRDILVGLSCFPLAIIFFLVYAHVVSFLDPFLTIVLGGGFLLAIILILGLFLRNMKDFIVSIFKENKEVDSKGFKKHF